jgi:MFS family permease
MCPLSTFWGRAPLIWWTAFFALFFNLGCVLAPDFATYYGMRSLVGLVSNAPPTIAVGMLQDMFFFHERARKVGLWTVCFIVSPVVGPLLGNFIMSQTNNSQHVLWMCFGVQGLYLIPLNLFMDETWYRRDLSQAQQPSRPNTFYTRFGRLTGAWQLKNHGTYFYALKHSVTRFVAVILKPVLVLIFLN